MAGKCPKCKAPMSNPGTILSQMPSSNDPSKTSCDKPTEVLMAIVSLENKLNSMPGSPWVTPSHIAGTPAATCTVEPFSLATVLISSG